MKGMLATLIICLAICGRASAQWISTLAGPNSGINDALVMDSLGNLYGSDFGQSFLGASKVYKLDTAGVLSVFSTGYSSCNGLDIDRAGRLYVVDFTANGSSNQIYRLDSAGAKSAYGPPIPGASGILFDPLSDTLYVSRYSSASGNRISKLAPDGTVSLHTDNPLLNGPVGMAFDSSQVLYVANFNDGEIYRVTQHGDSLELLAKIPNVSFWGIGFLTYASGYLFATGIGVHKIFKISLTGEVSEFAGTGIAGLTDGTADSARFNRPNGITTNRAQDKLYVSDFGSESIREITSSQLTSIQEEKVVHGTIASYRFQRHSADEIGIISYTLSEHCEVELKLYSGEGKLLLSPVRKRQPAGPHSFRFSTAGLPGGMYYGRLSAGEQMVVLKIAIAH